MVEDRGFGYLSYDLQYQTEIRIFADGTRYRLYQKVFITIIIIFIHIIFSYT